MGARSANKSKPAKKSIKGANSKSYKQLTNTRMKVKDQASSTQRKITNYNLFNLTEDKSNESEAGGQTVTRRQYQGGSGGQAVRTGW